MFKILIVLNPISGDADKRAFIKVLKSDLKRYGYAFRWYETTGKDDSSAIADILLTDNFHKILCIGGDGTVLITALGNKKSQIPIGIIPFGSANGMATELGLPKIYSEALSQVLISQKIKWVDQILINGEHTLLHIGDVGLNANLVASFSQDEHRGLKTYAKYFIEELKHSVRFKARVLDDQGIEHHFHTFMVAFCNSATYGTGVRLNDVSRIDDGLMELTLIKDLNLKGFIKKGIQILTGSDSNDESSITLQGKSFKIDFEHQHTLQIDGEVIGKFKHIHTQVTDHKIPFIT